MPLSKITRQSVNCDRQHRSSSSRCLSLGTTKWRLSICPGNAKSEGTRLKRSEDGSGGSAPGWPKPRPHHFRSQPGYLRRRKRPLRDDSRGGSCVLAHRARSSQSGTGPLVRLRLMPITPLEVREEPKPVSPTLRGKSPTVTPSRNPLWQRVDPRIDAALRCSSSSAGGPRPPAPNLRDAPTSCTDIPD